jgi:catechol 2,3-dioxygenase-like lactoylglutathione lyase family enzyme
MAMMGPRLQRANFVVADIDQSLRFYRDVLGFEVSQRQGHRDDSYSFPCFAIPAGAQIGFCVLSTASQPRVMALTGVAGTPLAPVPAPRRAAIVLEHPDLDSVIDGARVLGLEVVPEEALLTSDGRRGREVGIVDFDGNLVVLYSIEARE